MELEPEEERLVAAYLRASPEPSRRWVVTLVAGLVLCAAAVVMLVLGWAGVNDPFTLLTFVLGMVIVACSLDYHKWTVLARIIQKYDRAVRKGGAEER